MSSFGDLEILVQIKINELGYFTQNAASKKINSWKFLDSKKKHVNEKEKEKINFNAELNQYVRHFIFDKLV